MCVCVIYIYIMHIFKYQCTHYHVYNCLFLHAYHACISKKITYTNGTCNAKMVSIKDRNGMDLRESEDIKMRWQEYTEELYKADLNERSS